MKQTPKEAPIGRVKRPFSGKGVKKPSMDHPQNKGRKKAPIDSVKRPVTGEVVLKPAWDNLWDEEHENKLMELAIKQTLEEREATRPFTGEGVKKPAGDNLWDEEYKWMKEAIKLALEEREAMRKQLKICMDQVAEMHRTGIITVCNVRSRFPGEVVMRPAMDHPRHKGGRKKPPICHSKRLIMGEVILWLTWKNWDEEHEIKWIKEAIKQALEEREKKREKRRKYEEKRAERKKNGEEKKIEFDIKWMEEGIKQTPDLEALSLAKLIKLSKIVSKSKLCGGERETEKV